MGISSKALFEIYAMVDPREFSITFCWNAFEFKKKLRYSGDMAGSFILRIYKEEVAISGEVVCTREVLN